MAVSKNQTPVQGIGAVTRLLIGPSLRPYRLLYRSAAMLGACDRWVTAYWDGREWCRVSCGKPINGTALEAWPIIEHMPPRFDDRTSDSPEGEP